MCSFLQKTMNTNLSHSDLITFIYALCDDFLKEKKFRKPGREPRFTDAELIVLAMMQCLKGEESELRFLFFYRAELLQYFPVLPSPKEYNRRLRENHELLSHFFFLILELLAPESDTAEEKTAFADTAPVPITKHQRKPKGRYHDTAEYGYCASKKLYFWGYFLHLTVSPEGIPLQFTLLPAAVDETGILETPLLEPLRGFTLGGDKGYLVSDEKKRKLLERFGITLVSPYRRNQKKRNSPEETAFLSKRGIVERVFAWLENNLGLERTLTKTAAGIASRVTTKILFLGLNMALNSMLGKPLLQISGIWY